AESEVDSRPKIGIVNAGERGKPGPPLGPIASQEVVDLRGRFRPADRFGVSPRSEKGQLEREAAVAAGKREHRTRGREGRAEVAAIRVVTDPRVHLAGVLDERKRKAPKGAKRLSLGRSGAAQGFGRPGDRAAAREYTD